MVKMGLGILATGAALVLADAWFFEKYFFQVKRFRIGKKSSRRPVRIVLLTDLHFKVSFWPFHRRLLRKLTALRPDLILVTGDLIDEHGTPGPARKFAGRIRPDVPWLVIPGNHDNKNKVSRQTLRKLVEARKGHLLVNETVHLTVNGTSFTVTGLDDFIEGESNLAEAVRNVGNESNHLLLIHSPLQQEGVLQALQHINAQRGASQQLNIRYIFAGHTHGGQVRLPGFVPVLPEGAGDYVNGWYNASAPYLYVSKGFGTSAVPLRFGARPEITLFEYGV